MTIPDTPVAVEPELRARRSLFLNYDDPEDSAAPWVDSDETLVRRDPLAVVLARCFLAQFLARAFEYPTSRIWAWLCDRRTLEAVLAAAALADEGPQGSVGRAAAAVAATCSCEAFSTFHDDYTIAISHAAQVACPISATEPRERNTAPLLPPHRLADLATFFGDFGLEFAEDGSERPDHLAVALIFLAVMAGQESYALTAGIPDEDLQVNLGAQAVLLREHLGPWSTTFARHLQARVGDGPLLALARLLVAFVGAECARAGVVGGAIDAPLQPADMEGTSRDPRGFQQRRPGAEASNEID